MNDGYPSQYPASLTALGLANLHSTVTGGTLTIAGTLTANRTLTLPDANLTITGGGTLALGGFTLTVPATGTSALLAANNAFTGADTFTNAAGIIVRPAATQDGVQLLGRAGGTSSYKQIIATAALGADRTFTLPDANYTVTGGGTFALGGFTLTVPATGTAALLGTSNTFTNGAQIISAGTVTLDLKATSNTVCELKLWTSSTLRGAWQADSTSVRLAVGGNNILTAPVAGTSIQFPVSALFGTTGTVGSAPLTLSPASPPTSMPTGNQVYLALGLTDDATASYRTIGAGYFSGATNIPCAFGYAQTSSSGFTQGRWFVAVRSVVTDTAPSIALSIEPTGSVLAGYHAALSTSATDGFIYVPSCAGTPTGTPTAVTGMVPLCIDSTNNKLYFYSGSAWRDAGP